MSDQPKQPTQDSEQAKKLEEQRQQQLIELMRRNVEMFRNIVKGQARGSSGS